MAHHSGMWKSWLMAALAAACLLFLPTAEAALRYAAGAVAGTGNWNATGTWNSTGCGNATNNPTVPAAADDVIICPNRTVIITANQSARTITVNNTGILRVGNSTTARTLTVSGDITVNAGGTFEANPAFAAQHLLSHTGAAGVGGNIINDGTINFSNTSGGNNAACNVTFSTWTGTRTVSGSGTSGFNRISINGTSNTVNDIVDITAANFSMAAIGIAAPSAPLVLTDGTFRLSTPATIAPFGTAAFTLAANDRFWVNDPGAVVNYPVAATFTAGTGQLRIDSGTFNATANVATVMNVSGGRLEVNGGTLNIGSAVNNTLLLTSNAASTIVMTGGAINVAGRLASSTTTGLGVFNLSGGTITTGTVGNTTNNALNAPFFIGSAVSYTQSGGTIVIENANAGNNAREYDVRATVSSITGGTLQLGNATTTAGQTFQINSVPPMWNLDIVNNSIPSDPVALLIASLTINNNLTIGNGTTLSAGNNNITILGNWINNGATNSYIVGTGTVTFAGTAAQSLLGAATETTINRLILNNTAAAVADRKLTQNHDLRVTNTLTLTSGRIANSGLNTNPAAPKTIIPSGASLSGGSSSSFVSGRLQLNIPAGNNKTVTYPIGTEGAAAPALAYSPASFEFAGAGGTTGELIAYAVLGDHPQIGSSTLDAAKSVNRYWVLTADGVSGTAPDLTPVGLTINTTFTFLNPEDLDIGANTANFETERYNGSVWFTPGPGARTATTTQALGVNNAGEFAVAEKGAGGAPGGGFNIFDTDTLPLTATAGVIKTKVAGANFNLAVVSLNPGAPPRTIDTNYNKTVRVELLDASDNSGVADADGCLPNWTTVIATLTPDPTFAPSDNGRITVGPFNVANAYRDVRARVTNVTGVARRGCSSDNFAIRPNAFTAFSVSDDGTLPLSAAAGTARALNDVTFGTVRHKAGRPISVRANAVNAAGTPAITTNYTGSPVATLSACAGAACTATFGTLTFNTAFGAGQLVTDVANYDNVGSFSLKLTDDTFAAVDNADGSSVAEMRIESATIDVGRFVPDHFAVTPTPPVFTTGCAGGAFTYAGQTFGYATAPVFTVQARNFAGNATTLYTDNAKWWRITDASLTGKAYTAASGTLDTSGVPGTDPVINDAGSGSGSLTFSAGTGLFFTRTTPVLPFNAEISLAINIIDADGVVYESPIGTPANPARFGTASAGNGIAFSAGKQMRFGRLRIASARGSQLLPMPMQMQTQYWASTGAGASFVTNTEDSCTTIVAANIAMGPYSNNLSACETSLAVGGTPAGRFAGGRNTVQLSAPGPGNNGSVDLTVNLGAGSGSTCIAGIATAVTGAGSAYLQGNWSGGTYDQNPVGRATFGVYRGSEEIVHIRENF